MENVHLEAFFFFPLLHFEVIDFWILWICCSQPAPHPNSSPSPAETIKFFLFQFVFVPSSLHVKILNSSTSAGSLSHKKKNQPKLRGRLPTFALLSKIYFYRFLVLFVYESDEEKSFHNLISFNCVCCSRRGEENRKSLSKHFHLCDIFRSFAIATKQ